MTGLKKRRNFCYNQQTEIQGNTMLTLNIDNQIIENYFHSSTDEMFRTLEAIAHGNAKLVATNNTMPQAAIECGYNAIVSHQRST